MGGCRNSRVPSPWFHYSMRPPATAQERSASLFKWALVKPLTRPGLSFLFLYGLSFQALGFGREV